MEIKSHQIYFTKLHPEAQLPSKRVEDAAYDLYACFEEDYLIIAPHSYQLIPTKIASAFHPDKMIIFKERGSTGVKNMAIRSGVIDSGYRGEWFVNIANQSDKFLIIIKERARDYFLPEAVYHVYPYEKAIAQFLVLDNPQMEVLETDFETIQQFASERGQGALGSSGK